LEFNVPFQHKYGYIRDDAGYGKQYNGEQKRVRDVSELKQWLRLLLPFPSVARRIPALELAPCIGLRTLAQPVEYD